MKIIDNLYVWFGIGDIRIKNFLEFFIFDSIKIFVMLFVFISIIGFFRTFISNEKVEKYTKGKGFLSYFFASLFGCITPFCSCSSIPLFIGFINSGIPIGVSFAFLTTSPLVNEYLVVLMIGFFGIKITLLYVLVGMIIGISCGIIIDKINPVKYIIKDVSLMARCDDDIVFPDIKSRFKYGVEESINIIKRLWKWIILSVFVGALIHGYVPRETVEKLISKAGFFDVPIAVILGVPLYGSCASILPIAYALFTKGLPLGTALSFMMATSALSLPEAIMLSRVIKTKLIIIFFSIVAVSIIFIGYLFNFIQKIN